MTYVFRFRKPQDWNVHDFHRYCPNHYHCPNQIHLPCSNYQAAWSGVWGEGKLEQEKTKQREKFMAPCSKKPESERLVQKSAISGCWLKMIKDLGAHRHEIPRFLFITDLVFSCCAHRQVQKSAGAERRRSDCTAAYLYRKSPIPWSNRLLGESQSSSNWCCYVSMSNMLPPCTNKKEMLKRRVGGMFQI